MIRYLNTDLDLEADFALSSLATALESNGVRPLHVTEGDDGLWHASFETDDQHDEPEHALKAMLDAIDQLPEEHRSSLGKCTLCEFNIGYDCADEPWAFNNGVTNATLGRMARVGASLRMTLYPPDRDREGQCHL